MGDIQSSHCSTSNCVPQNADQSAWMSKLPDQMLITQLSIPGSHRSCSWQLTRGYQHQGLEPLNALKVGIRFFDVQLYMESRENFLLWQNNYPVGGTLISVIRSFMSFLRNSSSEVIFCCLTENYSSECQDNFADSLWEFLTANIADTLFWSSTELPRTLCEARGKIVFFRNYSDTSGRLVPYSKTEISNRTGLPNVINQFFDVLKKQLQEVTNGNDESLHVTYTSMKQPWLFPRDNANYINKYLLDFITELPEPIRLGIVVMDFPGQSLIENIIQCNFTVAVKSQTLGLVFERQDKNANTQIVQVNPLPVDAK